MRPRIMHGKEMVMCIQTFEAITDDNGNIRFADTVRLPPHTRVYVVVPEQTVAYTEIVPESNDLPGTTMRFPLVRIVDEGLAKRLVKTTDLGRSTLMPEIEEAIK